MKKTTLLAATVLAPACSFAGQPDLRDFNVVFLFSDQHKTSVTGCYGNEIVKTPNIDELACNGVRFTKMYTPSPLCAPARAALITGAYPSTNGAILHWMPARNNMGQLVETDPGYYRTGYSENLKTWGEYFKEHHYSTAAIGKMHVHGEMQKGVNPNYPEGNLMGFDVSDMRFYSHFPGGNYKDWKNNPDYSYRYRERFGYKMAGGIYNERATLTLLDNEEDAMDFAVAKKNCDYMAEKVKNKERFVIHVGFEKPHKPWTTFKRFMDLYKPDEMPLPETWRDWQDNGKYPYSKNRTYATLSDPDDVRRSMQAYYACVTEMDDAVGRVVQKTKELGVYDKTIFIYTSDHGEHLFEHGLHEKHNMFEASVSVPFIISCPALLPKNITCDSLASLLDVLPTLADLLKLNPEKQWEGRSLLSQVGAKKSWNRQVFSEIYEYDFAAFPGKNIPIRMLLDKKYKYIYTHGMIDQFYDVAADKNEMNNLAFGNNHADLIKKYRLMTLCDWKFELLPQMSASVKYDKGSARLKWTAVSNVQNYTIWKSHTGDVADAEKIGETESRTFTDTKAAAGDCYWITANWEFARNGERREGLPMITATYPDTLPVSPALALSEL
jgi:arylsulfatase A-like enzyme